MRKIFLSLLLIVVTLVSCTKEETALPDLKGTWTGKWGDEFQTQNNNYRLVIKSNDVVEINNGLADYTGTWRIDEYTFVASYVVNNQTITLKAPINKSHMEGIWRNVTSDQYKGTFYLDKQ